MRKPLHLPKKIFCVMLVFVLSILTGCSSEPSGSDIEKAIQTSVGQAQQMANSSQEGKMLTEAFGSTTIHAVKKLGCVQAQGQPGYRCDIELDATAPLVGRTKTTSTIRLVKGSDGWVIAP